MTQTPFDWDAAKRAPGRAIAQGDFLTACLCENLMNGRDPFAGFPKAGEHARKQRMGA